ncbi:MAG: CDP-alcohol phosphatidyltransferase family protein [Deltaproteobacteria bacterium]
MIDRSLYPLQGRVLAAPARALAAKGVSANQITLAGLVLAILAALAISFQFYIVGLFFILLNRLSDGLDGAVARLGPADPRGAYLDITLDFLFYGMIPLAFALANPVQNAVPAAVLLSCFLGTGTSFLAWSAAGAKAGLDAKAYPTKGILYLGGLTEGFETIALFVLACLMPAWFPWLAYIFAFACLLTIGMRIHVAWTTLAPTESPHP